MSKEGLPKSLEEALDREEQEALDKVTTYHRKIGLLIKANYIGVGLVYLGSAVASINGYPICLAGNIVTLPAALLLSRKLDHMDHKFWKENWLKIYRTGHPTHPNIIDAEFVDRRRFN